ncbi:hypothetical protein MMC28_008550 [Mycoblastus sanguinarius]|nr:hypothetical protein [Mycoblastus sanguinarius]
MSSGHRPASPVRSNRYAPPGRTSAGSFFPSAYDSYPAPTRSGKEYITRPRISGERIDARGLPPLRTRSPPRRTLADDYDVAPRTRILTGDAIPTRKPVSMIAPSSPTRTTRPIVTRAMDRPPSPVTKVVRRERRDDDYDLLPASSTGRRHHQRHSSLGEPSRLVPLDRAPREKIYLSGSKYSALSGGRASNMGRELTIRERRGEEDRDYGFEYTDPRDSIHKAPPPRPRPRRDSYDTPRPTSMIGADQLEGYIPRSSRDAGPPVSSRGFNDIRRSESQRQSHRARDDDRAPRDYVREERDTGRYQKPTRPEIALHQPSHEGQEPYHEEEPRHHRPRKLIPEDDKLEPRPRPHKLKLEDERIEQRPRDFHDDQYDRSSDDRPRKHHHRREHRDHDRHREYDDKDDRDHKGRDEPRSKRDYDDKDDRDRRIRDEVRDKRDYDDKDDKDYKGRDEPRSKRNYDDKDDRDRRIRDDARDRRDRGDDGQTSNGLLAGAGAAAAATGLAAEALKHRHRHKESRDDEGRSSKYPQDHLREPERDRFETSSVSTSLSGDTKASGEAYEETKEEKKKRRTREKEEEDREYEEAREEERRAREKAQLLVPEEDVRDATLREQVSYERRPDPEEPRRHRSSLDRRHHGRTRDRDSYSDSSSSSSSGDSSEEDTIERQPRVVTPSNEDKPEPPPAPKSILRKPRERFPEHPTAVREGVAPLKDAGKKDVPPNARWTKINRKLVNPESLEADGIRFEQHPDYVIVLKVMDQEEIQKYAAKTAEIREKRRALMAPPDAPKPDEEF